jgi:hypothetical protein
VFTDTTVINGLLTTDGYDVSGPAVGFDALARGVFRHVKCDMSTKAGKTTQHFRLRMDSDTQGATHKVVYKNIKITDGGSTTRLTIWSSGEPSANTTSIFSDFVNIQCGPSNSFRVYAFNAGTQVARRANYSFKGY